MCTHFRLFIYKQTGSLVILSLSFFLLFTQPALAQDMPPDETKTYPGVNEVIPQAASLTARIEDANSKILEVNQRDAVYNKLAALTESLETLEQENSDWENVSNWPYNRLIRVQSSYAELRVQYLKALNAISIHLQTLENLRNTWEKQKAYWLEWQAYLNKSNADVPSGAFTRSLTSIGSLLERIQQVISELVHTQQKYSTTQEILDSRISNINKTLASQRKETFQRNTSALFEADYYRQFEPELFVNFKNSLVAEFSLPANFFKRHGGIAFLQLISVVIITMLLIYRRKQDRPLPDELLFLFQRPLAGALFITIVSMTFFTKLTLNMPLTWKWLTLIVVTISAIRLLNAFPIKPLEKKIIRVIASSYIITESFRYFGLPTPLMQLYNVVLCSLAATVCWQLIRRKKTELGRQRYLFYLIFSVAIVCLSTAIFGFERLSTNLIDVTLSTLILLIIVKMALHLTHSGSEAIMQLAWIKNRQFTQVLGQKAAIQKLQTLLRIIIVINAGIYLLVVWMVFDNFSEARSVLLSYEFTFGEFNISVQMVFMVIVVLYLTTIISWVIQAFVDSQVMTPRNVDFGVKESLKRLTQYGLFTIGFLVAASMVGFDLQKFTILAGALGVGIGFGLQNIVNNFVCGLIMLFERPVKVGDIINIDQEWGTIKKIGLRSTICETFDQAEVIVPNSNLISNNVTNWTFSSKNVRVVLPVGVAYGSPLEKVLEILDKAAKEHSDVLSYPEPNPIVIGFGNNSIDFQLRFWIRNIDDRLKIRSEVILIINRLFREEGIEIPFPQRDLHLRSVDGNALPLFRMPPLQSMSDVEGISD